MTPEQALASAGARVRLVPPLRGQVIGRLRVYSVADAMTATQGAYLIKGILAAGELGVMFGEPACGKSFLGLHVAYALAQGRRIFGRRVVPSPVLYAALEGEGGMAKRVRALKAGHGDAPSFRYIAQSLPLGEDKTFADDIVKAVRETGARLVVIDTLARAMAGLDENTSADMGAMVMIFDKVRQETGAAVLVVHHSGKDKGRGARGSNALFGAADLEIEVDASTTGDRTLRLKKVKEGPAGETFGFTLRSVTVDIDADGDAVTTCLVDEGGAVAATKTDRLKPQHAEALRILHDTISGPDGAKLPNTSGFPSAVIIGCSLEAWRRECDARGLSSSDEPNNHRRVFNLAKKGLKDAGRVAERDGWIWPIPTGKGA